MQQALTKFDQLTIQSDFIFKKVMSKKRICKHLLEELLQIKIADISYPEVERTLDVYYDSRGIRLDIIVADDKNTHYNLEMQVKNPVDSMTGEYLLPKRTRYYQAMMDVDALQRFASNQSASLPDLASWDAIAWRALTNQLRPLDSLLGCARKKGQDFDKLPPTFVIFICVFDLFKEAQRVYTFKKQCLEKPALELNDQATVVFLNTLGTKGSVSKDLQSFCDYINSNIVTSEFTDEIAKTIVDVKYDKKVRKEYMLYEIRMKDLRNEALAEGMAKGKAEAEIQVAKNLLRMGLSTAQVVLATKLPDVEIERIKAELEAEKA